MSIMRTICRSAFSALNQVPTSRSLVKSYSSAAMVSDAQKKIIKDTWSAVDLQTVGNSFYVNMASGAPDSYAVFKFGGDKGKEAAQGLKVMQFIDSAVKNIDNLGTVKANIDSLAERHVSYGAKKVHFPPVGPCLVDAMASNCGGKWSPQAKDAWTAFYAFVSENLSAPLS